MVFVNIYIVILRRCSHRQDKSYFIMLVNQRSHTQFTILNDENIIDPRLSHDFCEPSC